MVKCDCERKFKTKKNLGSHRRFCFQFQKRKQAEKRKNEKDKNFICHICNIKYKNKSCLVQHYLKSKDKKHKAFILCEETIVLKALRDGKNECEVKSIFGAKSIRKIWKKYLGNKVDKIRKKFRYRKRTFICKKCKKPFSKVYNFKGLCRECQKNKCKICNSTIRKTKYNVCRKCLKNVNEYRETLKKSLKGINKGNPGWARTKTENNYIENRVFKKLKEKFNGVECQKRILNYRVDMIVNGSVIVECDGAQHYRTKEIFEKDKIRDKEIIKLGYKIIRFNANFILKKINDLNNETKKFICSSRKRKLVYLNADVAQW